MPVLLSLKLGDQESLGRSVHRQLLKRTLILVLPVILIQIQICAFLNSVPIYWGILSRTSWCCLAVAGGTPVPVAPNSWKLYILFCFFYC